MVGMWIVHTLVVSALVAGAAALLETGQVERGRPLRGAWIVGMLGAPLVIALSAAGLRPGGWHAPWLTPVSVAAGGGGSGQIGVGALRTEGPPVAAGGWFTELVAGVGAVLDPLAPWLLIGWGGLTFLLLVRWWGRHRALRRGLSGHPRLDLGGFPVVVTERLGPGLLGVFRTETLMPRWCLELPPQDRELVLAHEEEHRRKRDNLVLAAATLLRMLVPWNLPLWWMERRLRVAVELDCDARVAARHPAHRRRYAELLLHTASRRTHRWSAAPLALLAEPHVPLHRRILMLTCPDPGPVSRLRLGALTLGALGFVALAMLLPGPGLGTVAAGAQPAPPAAAVADTPTFTPFTVGPEIQNRAEVAAALEREYPSVLKEAGIGGRVLLYLFLNAEGEVQQIRLHESSGHAALDEAGLRVARAFEFSPALNRTTPVPVWIQIPVTFTAAATAEGSSGAGSGAGQQADPPPPPADSATPPSPEPPFTPFTVAPEVRNRGEVGRVLAQEYPPALREAGVGGTVLVYFYLDAEGAVQEVRVSEGSGHAALDEAGLRVARVFEFSPAMNRDERVPVWIQIPITFTTRR